MDPAFLQCPVKCGLVEHSCVGSGCVRANFAPEETVAGVHNTKENDGAVALTVVVERVTLAWFLDGHKFPVNSITCVVEVPSGTKLLRHLPPLIHRCRHEEQLFPVLLIYHAAHFRHLAIVLWATRKEYSREW